MTRKAIIVTTILLVPFIGGGVVGYTIGNARSDQGAVTTYEGAPFTEARTTGLQSVVQDTNGENLYDSRHNAITRTVATVSPAVVGINVTEVRQYRYRSPWGDDPFFRWFFGDQTYTQKIQGLGSGFLISSDGYILTNDHVAGNAKEITVTMTTGEKYKAELVGTDPVSDVALLKISGGKFPFITLGNSDDVIIGEWVIAFGNPYGLFDISDKPTVTVGVVSGTKMNITLQEGRSYRGMIQTDAAINAGNSGGPLVNSLGQVIGVNSAILTPNQGSVGIGFAIPINRVKSIVAELKRSGKIERQYWTGLEIQGMDERMARYFGLASVEGAIVSDVKPGSPAEKGGFKVGDIILSVNGEKVSDTSAMMAIVDDAKAGDVLTVKVFRDRKTIDLKLRLEKRST